jgi:hypothetical protein
MGISLNRLISMTTQNSFKIEVEENYNYYWRSLFSWAYICVILMLIILAAKYNGSVSWLESGILLLIVFGIIAFFSDDIMNQQYFIVGFQIEKDRIHLFYKDRIRLCEINGSRKEFKVEKVVRYERYSTTIFLEITYQDKVIRQYTRGDWNEVKFDEVIANFKAS